MDARDKVLRTLIRKRCGDALTKMREKGLVTSARYGRGGELEWRLVG